MTNEDEFMMMAMDPMVGRMDQVRKLLELKSAYVGGDHDINDQIDDAVGILLDSCAPKEQKPKYDFPADPDGNVTPFN